MNAEQYAYCVLWINQSPEFASNTGLKPPQGVYGGMAVLEIDRMMHAAHSANPELRDDAMEFVAKALSQDEDWILSKSASRSRARQLVKDIKSKFGLSSSVKYTEQVSIMLYESTPKLLKYLTEQGAKPKNA